MSESPYQHEYHQSLVTKIAQALKTGELYCTFAQALEMIRRIHHLTGGLKHVTYLAGWQFEGHDSKYPAWSEVNARLKRPEDREAVDSLRWLMAEARAYDTTVSLHINMSDAYENSPLWDLYRKEDLLIRKHDGELAKGGVWGGEQSYLGQQGPGVGVGAGEGTH